MKRLIKRILREEINKSDTYYRFLDKISSIIEKPYFRNMYEKYNGGFWDITDEGDQEYILKNIFGDDINIKEGITLTLVDYRGYGRNRRVYDDKGNRIYWEDSDGKWWKYEYDDNHNLIYYENSNGYWSKWEYDGEGYLIYRENSNGEIEDIR